MSNLQAQGGRCWLLRCMPLLYELRVGCLQQPTQTYSWGSQRAGWELRIARPFNKWCEIVDDDCNHTTRDLVAVHRSSG